MRHPTAIVVAALVGAVALIGLPSSAPAQLAPPASTSAEPTSEETSTESSDEIAAAEPAPADPARGAELYRRACAQCHGRNARGASSYPRLSGKPAERLTEALLAYRAGQRRGPNSALMFGPARNLSDTDIADVVAFLSTLE